MRRKRLTNIIKLVGIGYVTICDPSSTDPDKIIYPGYGVENSDWNLNDDFEVLKDFTVNVTSASQFQLKLTI